ncbi:MAG: alpha/beta fold hydrolase, partial [Myxococcota bacterium]
MSLIGNPLPSERSNGSVLEERAARPLVAGAEAENPLDRVESVGTPERVAAASPLDAAFVRTEAPMRQAGREDALTLEEVLSTDSDSLIAGQDGVLVPLAGGDPNRAPVVLVHGLNGSPRELGDIAARFLSRGRPVHVFVYESQSQAIGRSAELLASELQGLRERVGAQRIDIVAHSMGGLVARAALNRMPEPPIDTVNLRMQPARRAMPHALDWTVE